MIIVLPNGPYQMRWKTHIYTFLISVIVAYLLTTNRRFMDFGIYIKQPTFWLLLFLAVVLLWVYLFWISAVQQFCYTVVATRPEKSAKRWHAHVRYYVCTIVPLASVHLLIMALLFRIAGSGLWESGYLRRDFWFFVSWMVGMAVLLQRQPHWSVYHRALQLWGMHREQEHGKGNAQPAAPDVLLEGNRPEPGANGYATPKKMEESIKIQDILLIDSYRRGAVIYLITGESIAIKASSSIVDSWKARCWFLKAGKGRCVNMWHLSPKYADKYLLEPVVAVKARFMDKQHWDEKKWRQKFHVSRWFRKDLAHHLEIREQLPRDCWDEYYECP